MNENDSDVTPLRVLVVDDDAVDRMAVRRHLARTGLSARADEAEGVLEAIGRLTDEPYDCVLLDFNLPDGDGLTFLRGLRTAGIRVPVIMLTGQSDPEIAADLVMAGASDYLPKSLLSPGRLLQSLTRCCAAHASVRRAIESAE
ncbi:response regulator [Longimicrobium sp.]|uniref:response regulator n=1 Tax=Longimicrobium sp. TaxID=2029185 RepID=UPI002E379625|nr:response regulator [Longimicrobium sp.]HEX6039356.1 response regulator [Longimicrobium sp.]